MRLTEIADDGVRVLYEIIDGIEQFLVKFGEAPFCFLKGLLPVL